MKKRIIDFLLSDKVIIITLIVSISLFTWFWISYDQSRDVEYKYNGIKYLAGNLQSAEPINIEIKGKYVKQLFVENVDFYGTIKVGENAYNYNPITFNKYKMGSLEPYGMIYISDGFEKLTIEILEPNQYGGRSFSYRNGWLISAPCNDRKEAVEVSNALIQRLYKGLVIE